MSPFDMQMVAITSLIVLLTIFMRFIDKKMVIAIAGLLVILVMVWGDDMCSRKGKLHFYSQHFDAGGEIICQDVNSNPFLISQTKGWERKGQYLFKENRGIEILNDQCEIIGQKEPRCISETWMIITGIAASIWMFGWMALTFRRHEREYKKEKKDRELRKEKIRVGAAEMAELYKNDPELRELNEFVGDYHELPHKSQTQENTNV